MRDYLRPLVLLLALGLISACASKPSSPLGELPRTPQASTEQLLEQAQTANPEKAKSLRLSAAEQSFQQGNLRSARSILEQVDLAQLKPAEQVFAVTLQAEIALASDEPARARTALQHPSLQWLPELPVEQQVRTHMAQARAYELTGDAMAAARERVFIAPLVSGTSAAENQEAIWTLVSALPPQQLTGNPDLDGWLRLAATVKQPGTLAQQHAAIDAWREQHPNHPAARQLPEQVAKLRALEQQPLERIGLLLPLQGQLASVAGALRDGFLAAHLEASRQGMGVPQVRLYDSGQFRSLDDFYRQAQSEGIQLVVGPLDKDQVRELGSRPQLPVPTLALNYTDARQHSPSQLFQFGLAAEDEARAAAKRAWADGHRAAIALTPRGEWGERVLAAFRQAWRDQGGNLVAAEPLSEPVDLANQIARLLQVREAPRTTGDNSAPRPQPTRRQDVDFVFLAATPQQAQQVKPILVFQYAGDLPVYATSHLHSATENRPQYHDLEGIRFAETPWLLDPRHPLRQQVQQQWPQAAGSLGRLYAMGADAYLLATRLSQLEAMPGLELEGASGVLTLSSERRVERAMPWAEFRAGEVVPLSAPAHDAQ